MKLLGSTISKITKDENDKNVHLEVIEVILVHCNIFNNDYQHDSRILYTFVPNKPFGQLLDISPRLPPPTPPPPKKYIYIYIYIYILKTFNSEFSCI